MDKPKHTPGPWVVKGLMDGQTLCVTDHDSRYIVDRFVLGNRPLKEHEANARLIATAPDLLSALQNLLDAFDAYNAGEVADVLPEIKAAHAAALKAIG